MINFFFFYILSCLLASHSLSDGSLQGIDILVDEINIS